MATRKDAYELAASPEQDKASKPLLGQNLNDSPAKNDSSLEETPRSLFRETVQDKYYIVYFIFLLFGISILLPWNIFITAEDVRLFKICFQSFYF
jgi:NADH:ubiquinone oxidoreductase subunit 3 (subunit A)